MMYESLEPIERPEAEAILGSDDPKAIVRTLLRLALHEADWRWVQTISLTFVRHPSVGVRRAVATALGHLARLHGTLDLATALPALRSLAGDPGVAGAAQDAIDDVEWYTKAQTAAS
jgi:hypothetical protein